MSSTRTSRRASPGRASFAVLLTALAFLLPGGSAVAVTQGRPVAPDVYAERYPWVLAIESKSGKSLCTGVLISRRYVLTAGHCSGTNNFVKVGSPYRSSARRVAVRDSIRHPQFRSEGGQVEADLAVLRLVRPLRIKPLAIATKAESWPLLRPGKSVRFLGWGRVLNGQPNPDQLHAAELFLHGLNVGSDAFVFRSELGGPCSGDSGGPLIIEPVGGEPLLVGVASVTDGNLCAKGGGMAAYADVTRLRDFIEASVPDLVERTPPVEFPTLR